jgi:predicted DsbA family dithiol-disulfide isomerase
MRATVWSDYCCPWCYLALDREALLEDLGVELTVLPYELHPETPAGGAAIRPGGRRAEVFERVGAECEAVGLPFTLPRRSPNTRAVLEVAEVVRRTEPDAFPALHRALFAAHFADGRDLTDPAVVDDAVAAAGADPERARALVATGEGAAALAASMAQAAEHDVTGTPAFLLGERLLVPGVQPRESLERWVGKLSGSNS